MRYVHVALLFEGNKGLSTYTDGLFVEGNPSVAAFFFALEGVASDRSAAIICRRLNLKRIYENICCINWQEIRQNDLAKRSKVFSTGAAVINSAILPMQ